MGGGDFQFAVVGAVSAMADARGIKAAGRCDRAAGDGDSAAGTVRAAADARAAAFRRVFAVVDAVAAFRRDLAAGDGNIPTIRIAAAADARGPYAAVRLDRAAVDSDGAACATKASADACAVIAGGVDVAVVDDDGAAVDGGAAADARAILAAVGVDGAAVDSDGTAGKPGFLTWLKFELLLFNKASLSANFLSYSAFIF